METRGIVIHLRNSSSGQLVEVVAQPCYFVQLFHSCEVSSVIWRKQDHSQLGSLRNELLVFVCICTTYVNIFMVSGDLDISVSGSVIVEFL